MFTIQRRLKWVYQRLKSRRHSVDNVFLRKTFYMVEANSVNYINQIYLQSRLMPTAKHFLNRQNWHRFRFNRITKHFPSRKHRYSICFWMLRRKKPYKKWKASKKHGEYFRIIRMGKRLNGLHACITTIETKSMNNKHLLCIPRRMLRHNDNRMLYHRTPCRPQTIWMLYSNLNRHRWIVVLQIQKMARKWIVKKKIELNQKEAE